MWIAESDSYRNMSELKFYVDDPVHIPRIGEFIDGDEASGWVSHIQWNYMKDLVVINVLLKANKDV
jgi:hypothetical protein